MGNICRSPTAEGVFRKLHRERVPQLRLHIDSAGTHGYHLGEPPDARARQAAQRRGVEIGAHRGRMVAAEDFIRFDYMLAMDQTNLRRLESLRPAQARAQLGLLLDFAATAALREVPDPYYDGPQGFEHVLDLVEQGCLGLLRHLCAEQQIPWEPVADKA